MLKINKEDEPDFLLNYKKRNSPRTWADYNKDEIRGRIKAYILEFEQKNYCPYCEKGIYKAIDGHIEHIKCRAMFPSEFQSYKNLLVSCNEKNSCGVFKGNSYDDKFINPVLDNPKEYLEFNMASGEIVSKIKDESSKVYMRASYTISILNLNRYELKEARKALIDILETYRENYDEYNEYLQFFLDDGHNFPSLIKYYMEL